jgi:hypothetical protein
MYLALIPDEQTTKALRAFAPALPTDAHCTIIHSKARLPVGMPLPEWSKLNGSFVYALSQGLAVFGGTAKKSVLQLRADYELVSLRERAEKLLTAHHFFWSKEWAFSLHVTLGGADAQLVGEPPALLRFDRMEWRP